MAVYVVGVYSVYNSGGQLVDLSFNSYSLHSMVAKWLAHRLFNCSDSELQSRVARLSEGDGERVGESYN